MLVLLGKVICAAVIRCIGLSGIMCEVYLSLSKCHCGKVLSLSARKLRDPVALLHNNAGADHSILLLCASENKFAREAC